MDKRKRLVSVLAGIMAAVLLFGLIAGVLPMLVSAEELSSSEIEKQLDEL